MRFSGIPSFLKSIWETKGCIYGLKNIPTILFKKDLENMMILEKIINYGFTIIFVLLVLSLIEHIVKSIIYAKLDI